MEDHVDMLGLISSGAKEAAVVLPQVRRRHPLFCMLAAVSIIAVSIISRIKLESDPLLLRPLRQQLISDAPALLRERHPAMLKPPFTQWSYFIALNLFNNEDILPQLHDQLLLLAAYLGENNVYVSIYENGSRDRTKQMLADLSVALAAIGVGHSIVSGEDDWRLFCDEIVDTHDRSSCHAAPCVKLRDCPNTVRIPVMAAIRNMALLPLLNVSTIRDVPQAGSRSGGNSPSPTLALGLPHPVRVVFLNDVVVYAEDVVELISTAGGEYDMACGMDYEILKFYDTWVARDMSGATMSGWYPYLRDATAQALLRKGEPFRVFSCWNGAVVVPASIIVEDGILFRSWGMQEVRSLHPAANQEEVFAAYDCPTSECQLFCKDLWAAGRRRIYMNPKVQLFYNTWSEFLQRTVMRVANTLVLSWSHRLASVHHALRSPFIQGVPVGESVPWLSEEWDENGVDALPKRLTCGLSDEDNVK